MRQHVPLFWQRPPATNNQRQHYIAKAATTKQTIADARWAIRAAHLQPMPLPLTVTIVWRIADRRRRDVDGLGLTLKHCLDALVHECDWLPDDSWQYVTETRQRIVPPQPDQPAAMWLYLTSQEAPSTPIGASRIDRSDR